MLTSALYLSRLEKLGITYTQAEIVADMRAFMVPFTEKLDTCISIDNFAGSRFRLSKLPVVDDLFTANRSANEDLLTNPGTILTVEPFDFADPLFVQTEQIAIDYANSVVSFLTPIGDDLANFRYSYVNEEAMMNRIMLQFSLKNPVTEERRGNVTIKKRSYQDILTDYNKLNQQSGQSIEKVRMTRFSCGEVKGIADE